MNSELLRIRYDQDGFGWTDPAASTDHLNPDGTPKRKRSKTTEEQKKERKKERGVKPIVVPPASLREKPSTNPFDN